MSKLTIKSRSVQEATEPDINKAYNEFSAVLDKYNDNTANFMKDCVYIAHSRGENLVNGLRKQGYKLNLAAQLDTDTLHTCYVKEDNGVHKAIDLYFNPHRRVVEVILLGFDPDYPNAETTKFFSVQKGADAFADFIEGLSDYKGESKMKESKFKIKVHESKETLQDRFGSFQDFVDYCDAKVHDKLVELLGEEQGDTCFREITQPELTYKDKRGHKLVHKNDNPIHLNVLQEWWKQNFDMASLDGCCDSLADGYAKDPKPVRIVTSRRGKDVTDKWKLQRESKKSEKTTHIIGEDDFITWLYAGDMAARDAIEADSDEGFKPEYMDEAVKNILPKLFKMYDDLKSVEELSEVLQEEYYKG